MPELPKLPKEPICDFCKSPEVVTCFLSTPRQMSSMPDRRVVIRSDEHWVACEGCAVYVRMRSPQLLANRSWTYGPREHQGVSREALALIQSGMFWPGFKGDEHPITDHDTED